MVLYTKEMDELLELVNRNVLGLGGDGVLENQHIFPEILRQLSLLHIYLT